MQSTPADNGNSIGVQFRTLWPCITADSNFTLHGFRRFKTTHLLNLRFLENEIAELDHIIYQAGLSLEGPVSPCDRLGLKHSQKDANVPAIPETITKEFVLKLRGLIQQYGMYSECLKAGLVILSVVLDEALDALNRIMNMETMSLLDDEQQSSMRTELTLQEKFETRLVRTDLGTRSRTDPFQRWLHRYLRSFRYWRMSKKVKSNPEAQMGFANEPHWSYQNTIWIANVAGRVITAVVAGAFLVVPLILLSPSVESAQLGTVSGCILLFSFLIGALLKISNYEMMVVSAAYAAVLSVFVSSDS